MKSQQLISVIIPVYNTDRYIKEYLDSSEKDKRIIALSQKNQYAGVARNTGMRIARGDYIIFLDANDFFDQEMLMTMSRKGIQ